MSEYSTHNTGMQNCIVDRRSNIAGYKRESVTKGERLFDLPHKGLNQPAAQEAHSGLMGQQS